MNDFKRNQIEVEKGNEKYLQYIRTHCENVQKMFQDLFLSRIDELEEKLSDIPDLREAIMTAKTQVVDHDLSKYSDEEFDAYRIRFYPTPYETRTMSKELMEEKFLEAWKHHCMNNPHHPKYWSDENGKPTDMDLADIIHMICDWAAMSYQKGGTVIEWYSTKAEEEKSEMTDHTKEIVQKFLDVLF